MNQELKTDPNQREPMKVFLIKHLWARRVGTLLMIITLPIWLPLALVLSIIALVWIDARRSFDRLIDFL
jgi:hypothetical protein